MNRPALRRWVGDAVLAVAVLFVGLHGTGSAALLQGGSTRPDPLAYTLVVAAAAVLVFRRRWPLLTLAAVTLATSVYLFFGYPYGPIFISMLIAVYTVARWRATRTAVIASVLAGLFLIQHILIGRGGATGLLGVVPVSAWVVVPLAIGVLLRIYRETADRNRAEWARRHADEERLRVAQEVHDVVGHGLSAIAMQADIALHVLPRQPDHAAVALAAISRTSKEALDELRATLAAVRRDPESDVDVRAPLPGLARLGALVTRMSDSGVPVAVESTGERRPLPPAVDLAAYRVIQESLTNVLRHAGPASVTVRLSYDPESVEVEVRDTGARPAGPVTEGHGIAGMRRRAESLGGTLQAQPVVGGGFRVQARLPIP
jgi:signal transduction histidine kinase